jgi:ribonucleoside-diphosphate reductase alpha chain
MPDRQKKDNGTSRAHHARVAQAIFAATEAAGISDRYVAERITEQVIRRLDKGSPGTELPLPGMEDLLGGDASAADARVENIVEEALGEMGHHEVAEAYRSQRGRSNQPKIREKPQPLVIKRKKERPVETSTVMRLSENAMRVLEKRYLGRDAQGEVIETPEELFRRVAHCVAAAELQYDPQADVAAWEERFYRAMTELEFLPNSPTLMNAGRELGQLSACFVLPIEDSMESIFDAVKYTALIHKSGGGTGFSFSRLRPETDRVGSTGGIASGPISFIRAFDTATDVIKQGGMRRGANMAILSVDHPDIMKFITAKDDLKSFSNFNFSVAMTEAFMKAAEKGEDYDLINPHTQAPEGSLNAKQVFDDIVNHAWKSGDPGIVFLDRINKDNPVPKLGNIESTNPCGEQPLLPYESCNLGSINLAKMITRDKGKAEVDYAKLAETVKLVVRFLDNVIDVNNYPLPQIEKMSKTTRKIGLGIMGFADTLIQLGIPYNSEEAIESADKLMGFINEESMRASQELAEQRGAFPAFEDSIYAAEGLPKVRNAARTTIAPTGTLSIIANCSSGIEPLFAVSYIRTILEGEQLIEVNPYFEEGAKDRGFYNDDLVKELANRGTVRGMEEVPADIQEVFVTAHDIVPEWHVRMQAAFQRHTDNAVSKTVNFPSYATPEDVAQVFMLAYEEGCKGITIYRDGSKDAQVLRVGEGRSEENPTVTRGPRKRPEETTGYTRRVSTGCGHIYVTVNNDDQGICEVFSTLGMSGGCATAQLQAISRLISLALRSGVDISSIVKNLRGIRCPSLAWENGHAVLSCSDAIGTVLQANLQDGNGQSQVKEIPLTNGPLGTNVAGQCPECAGILVYQEGCNICMSCGYTKCG